MIIYYNDPNLEDDIDEIEDDLNLDDIDYDAQAQVENVDDNKEDSFLSSGKVILSKHSQNGKHSLSYDTIFKGKKATNDLTELEELGFYEDELDESHNQKFSVEVSTIYWDESMNNEEYVRSLRVKEKIYDILKSETEIKLESKRRRPSKVDFNNYYYLLKSSLKSERFTNTEMFIELASYFSDNLFNMFKLLDNKWKSDIIAELQAHIGKVNGELSISKKNLQPDTEIIFKINDMTINGIIIDADHENNNYLVNSFEKLYEIPIESIIKITMSYKKYKYNLNKLNNIDFL